MSNISRTNVLKLYKDLLHASRRINNYNFKSYAIRRVKDEFRKYQSLKDSDILSGFYQHGLSQLQLVKRQATISELYPETSSVIHQAKGKYL